MKRLISALLCTILILLHISVYGESATATLADMYSEAELLMVQGDFIGAAEKFDAMGTYSDASQMAMYCKAIATAETLGMYSVAIDAFTKLGDFKDCSQMAIYYTGRMYQAEGDAYDLSDLSIFTDNELLSAKESYEKSLEIYADLALFKDCMRRLDDCQTNAEILRSEIVHRDEEKQKLKNEKKESKYLSAVELEDKGEYAKAIAMYQGIDNYKNYKDCADRISHCQKMIEEEEKEKTYQEAIALKEKGDYLAAAEKFSQILAYKNTNDIIQEIKDLCKATYRIKSQHIETYNKVDKKLMYTQDNEYFYDDEGKLIKISSTNKEGKKSVVTYEYKNGKKTAHYDDGDDYIEYSDDGKKIVQKFKLNDGSYQTITQILDSYGSVIETQNSHGGNYTYSYKYVFNDDGSVAQRDMNNGAEITIYEYDILGFLLQEVSEDYGKGNTQTKRTIKYSYERIPDV